MEEGHQNEYSKPMGPPVGIPGGHGVGIQNLLPHSGLLPVSQGCIGLELCSLLESPDSHLTEHLLPGRALHNRKITASLLLCFSLTLHSESPLSDLAYLILALEEPQGHLGGGKQLSLTFRSDGRVLAFVLRRTLRLPLHSKGKRTYLNWQWKVF